jgi:very-short-patch-repair endonuclease
MKYSHTPALTPFAQKLRREMTEEERHLWYDYLRLLPVRFRRQKVIGNYIVDFYCSKAALVIELDGSQHYTEEGMARDARRTRYLESLGLLVLRYTNLEIKQHFPDVCEDIGEKLRNRLKAPLQGELPPAGG